MGLLNASPIGSLRQAVQAPISYIVIDKNGGNQYNTVHCKQCNVMQYKSVGAGRGTGDYMVKAIGGNGEKAREKVSSHSRNHVLVFVITLTGKTDNINTLPICWV